MTTEPSLKQALRDTIDGWFTPDKKRDAARLLRKVKGAEKVLAEKYAVMLEKEATADQYANDQFNAYCKREEELARNYEENNR